MNFCKAAVLVAPGPTAAFDLRGVKEHLARLRERRVVSVLAVGDAYALTAADAYYHCDEQWWKAHWSKMPEDRVDRSFSLDPFPGTFCFQQGFHFQINTDFPRIIVGQHSGVQAINVAYHFGARHIALVGYNLQTVNGKTHFFGTRGPGVLNVRSPYQDFVHVHERAEKSFTEAGLRVYNCTTSSALRCYPRMDLTEFVWRAINDKFASSGPEGQRSR